MRSKRISRLIASGNKRRTVNTIVHSFVAGVESVRIESVSIEKICQLGCVRQVKRFRKPKVDAHLKQPFDYFKRREAFNWVMKRCHTRFPVSE